MKHGLLPNNWGRPEARDPTNEPPAPGPGFDRGGYDGGYDGNNVNDLDDQPVNFSSVTFAEDVAVRFPVPRNEPLEDPFRPFASRYEFEWAAWIEEQHLSQSGVTDLFRMLDHTDRGRPFASYEEYESLVAEPESEQPIPWREVTIAVKMEELFVDGEPQRDVPSFMKKPFVFRYRDPIAVVKRIIEGRQFPGEVHAQNRVAYNKYGHHLLSEVRDGAAAAEHKARLPWGITNVMLTLSADKGSLNNGRMDRSGYPGYISVANLAGTAALEIGRDCMIKVAEFPDVPVDANGKDDPLHRRWKDRLLSICYDALLQPLHELPRGGIPIKWSDGNVRMCDIAIGIVSMDYPEVVLSTGVVMGNCGICETPAERLDTMTDTYGRPWRLRTQALEMRRRAGQSEAELSEAELFGSRSGAVGIFDSSRKGWDVYKAICIDIPRTILKPASEYIADWVWAEVTGDDDDGPGWAQWAELTRRFFVLPIYPNQCHFSVGLDHPQWNMDDCRDLIKILPCALYDLHLPTKLIDAVEAYCDFAMLARLPAHSDVVPGKPVRPDAPMTTLARMEFAVAAFYDLAPQAFQLARGDINEGQQGFGELRRMHMWRHTADSVRRFGPLVNLSTDIDERRRQIDEKAPFQRSNHLSVDERRANGGVGIGRSSGEHKVVVMEEEEYFPPDRRGSDVNNIAYTDLASNVALRSGEPSLITRLVDLIRSDYINKDLQPPFGFSAKDVKLRIVEAMKFSRVRHDPTHDVNRLIELTEYLLRSTNDWLGRSPLGNGGRVRGPRRDFILWGETRRNADKTLQRYERLSAGRVKLIFNIVDGAKDDWWLLVEELELSMPGLDHHWQRYPYKKVRYANGSVSTILVRASHVAAHVQMVPRWLTARNGDFIATDETSTPEELFEQHDYWWLNKRCSPTVFDLVFAEREALTAAGLAANNMV